MSIKKGCCSHWFYLAGAALVDQCKPNPMANKALKQMAECYNDTLFNGATQPANENEYMQRVRCVQNILQQMSEEYEARELSYLILMEYVNGVEYASKIFGSETYENDNPLKSIIQKMVETGMDIGAVEEYVSDNRDNASWQLVHSLIT